jgi:hypothetical protein
VPLDEGLGADRLLGGNEVGDDGTQHLEATIVGTTHVFTFPSHPVGVYFTVINSGDTVREAVRVANGLVATSL